MRARDGLGIASAAAPVQRKIGRPVGVDGADTRERIIRVAMECFARDGYAATSTRTIAEGVGLTQPALYKHFATKKDLMLAVHAAAHKPTNERVRAAVSEKDTFQAKITAMVDAVHELVADDPIVTVFATRIWDEARQHEELKVLAENRIFADLYAEIVDFGVASGEIDPEDALAVRGLLAVLGVGLGLLANNVEADVHAAVTDACRRMITGTLMRSEPTKVHAQAPTPALRDQRTGAIPAAHPEDRGGELPDEPGHLAVPEGSATP